MVVDVSRGGCVFVMGEEEGGAGSGARGTPSVLGHLTSLNNANAPSLYPGSESALCMDVRMRVLGAVSGSVWVRCVSCDGSIP